MYNIYMKTISTTNLRAHIADVLDTVARNGDVFGIGRHNKIEAYLIPAPKHYNAKLDEITNIAANSSSYNFLKSEPDLYTLEDCEEVYV